MPVTLRYPGVYLEEVPSGVQAIAGVPTSITVFVGRAGRGAVGLPTPVHGLAEFTRCFGPPSGAGVAEANLLWRPVRDFFANGGTQAVVLRLFCHAPPSTGHAQLAIGPLRLQAADPGAWGNQVQASVVHDADDPARFDLQVLDTASGQAELHRGLGLQPDDPQCVQAVLQQRSRLLRTAGDLPAQRPPEGASQLTRPGDDGLPLSAADYQGDEAAGTGLHGLAQLDLFNLLCLAPPDAGTDVPAEVWPAAAALCGQRRAMLLIDPPAAWRSAADALAGAPALCADCPDAALYFPRLSGAPGEAPAGPSGAVAGVIARTDDRRGVWKAPAGTEATLMGTAGPALPLTDAETGALNRQAINSLRAFERAGPVVWGARTRQGSDAASSPWKYLPVRRLALHIEESLRRGTQWAVFEPAGEPLFARLRQQVGSFLRDLFAQGAFQGAKPADAWFVQCGSASLADLQRGIVTLVVGFAPLRPAEFVLLRLQLATRPGEAA